MPHSSSPISRRRAIRDTGLLCTAAALGGSSAPEATAAGGDPIREAVQNTRFIDTHEHLMEEEERLQGKISARGANDWSFLFSHYINSDLISCGMPRDVHNKFLSPDVDPLEKWQYLEPYWLHVRNTGYGQAVEIAIREVYGIESLTKDTVAKVQEAYIKAIKPGYYKTLLQEIAGIESCQVNYLGSPFSESQQPQLLMQDISILGMTVGPRIDTYAKPAGIEVKDLSDWHKVIDWWFEKYGSYAVAVKSQAAYSRNIDFEQVPAEEAAPVFQKRIQEEPRTPEESKKLEDHLFWYCVGKATEHQLPVKLHTGYYAGENGMPLSRLLGNAGAATNLCRLARDTQFVFMHIGYPYYEDFIAAAKHYTNCHIDMCWAWIVSPVASVNFLKQYLVTAPANKVLTFGGDYIPVEPVVGHAAIARNGIVNALTQLVHEGWLTQPRAVELVDPIMRGNAHSLFRLEEKQKRLAKAPWLK